MSDEQQIRAWVSEWLAASKAGDIEKTLGMLTDDVVFLLPGREPMRKPEFAEKSRAQSGAARPTIEGQSEIQEVQIAGEWAFIWTKLSVTVTPAGGGAVQRRGHTLTVFRKVNGNWLLARDANLLTPATK